MTRDNINPMAGPRQDDMLAGRPEYQPGGQMGQGGILDLLPLAFARPDEALARARHVLAGHPGPYDASVARQTIGIVLRDFGDATAAIGELRAALRLAGRAGSGGRQAGVQGPRGAAVAARPPRAGRAAAGRGAPRRGGAAGQPGAGAPEHRPADARQAPGGAA